MEDELEVIRSQMEETRSSLADKIDALENQVLGTVETATHAVADTVENVKESVAETVETVKDTFNMRKHVENHPWLAFGGSVATGYVVGCLLTPASKEPEPAPAFMPQNVEPSRSYSNGAALSDGRSKKESEEEEEGGIIHDGIKMIKGLAVGSIMSLVHDLVKRSAPPTMLGDLAGFVDNVTEQLGGKRLWENEATDLLPSDKQEDTGHDERQSAKVGRPMGTTRW